MIVIPRGKGGRRREVPIRRELAQLLLLHIGARRAGPLFQSRQKGRGPTPHVYTRQRVGQIVREVAREAGVAKRVHPHLLRHTVATRLLSLGMDITDVQRFVGHVRDRRGDEAALLAAEVLLARDRPSAAPTVSTAGA